MSIWNAKWVSAHSICPDKNWLKKSQELILTQNFGFKNMSRPFMGIEFYFWPFQDGMETVPMG